MLTPEEKQLMEDCRNVKLIVQAIGKDGFCNLHNSNKIVYKNEVLGKLQAFQALEVTKAYHKKSLLSALTLLNTYQAELQKSIRQIKAERCKKYCSELRKTGNPVIYRRLCQHLIINNRKVLLQKVDNWYNWRINYGH